jgi:hypothetical protein
MPLHLDLHEVAEKGVLTGEAVGRRQPTASMVEMAPKSVKVLLARLPNCTRAPRTLVKALPMMRSNGEGAHQRWAKISHVIHGSQRRSGPMIVTLGAK